MNASEPFAFFQDSGAFQQAMMFGGGGGNVSDALTMQSQGANETTLFDDLASAVTTPSQLSQEALLNRTRIFHYEKLLKALHELKKELNQSSSWVEQHQQQSQCSYCDGGVRRVVESYNNVHGYVSLVVCILGTFANILNIAVLTRKDMSGAPINRILKWLAVTDMFVMIEYIPFACYKYLVHPGQMDFPRPWAVYLLFHMNFAQVLHTTSICLTLSLAVWRYIAIKYPHMSHVLCTERRCSIAMVVSFALPPLLCAPTYAVFRVRESVVSENGTRHVLHSVDADDREGTLYRVNFWIHAVVVKMLPCAMLTVISVWLVRALYTVNRRRLLLRGGCYDACPAPGAGGGGQGQATSTAAVIDRPQPLLPAPKQSKSDKRADRTTKMLVAVLLLFLITEIPQGVLGLLSGILGRCFFIGCYSLFGDIMDILALINGAINFILYCSMSRQFRMTFGQLFKPKILAKWPTNASQTEVQSTYV